MKEPRSSPGEGAPLGAFGVQSYRLLSLRYKIGSDVGGTAHWAPMRMIVSGDWQ